MLNSVPVEQFAVYRGCNRRAPQRSLYKMQSEAGPMNLILDCALSTKERIEDIAVAPRGNAGTLVATLIRTDSAPSFGRKSNQVRPYFTALSTRFWIA